MGRDPSLAIGTPGPERRGRSDGRGRAGHRGAESCHGKEVAAGSTEVAQGEAPRGG